MTCLQLLGAFPGVWMGIPPAMDMGKDLLVELEQGPAAPVRADGKLLPSAASRAAAPSAAGRERGRKTTEKIEVKGTGVGSAKLQEQELLKMLWDPRSGSFGVQRRMGVEVTWF